MRQNPFAARSARPADRMFGRKREIMDIRSWADDIKKGGSPDPPCFIGAPGHGEDIAVEIHERHAARQKLALRLL